MPNEHIVVVFLAKVWVPPVFSIVKPRCDSACWLHARSLNWRLDSRIKGSLPHSICSFHVFVFHFSRNFRRRSCKVLLSPVSCSPPALCTCTNVYVHQSFLFLRNFSMIQVPHWDLIVLLLSSLCTLLCDVWGGNIMPNLTRFPNDITEVLWQSLVCFSADMPEQVQWLLNSRFPKRFYSDIIFPPSVSLWSVLTWIWS